MLIIPNDITYMTENTILRGFTISLRCKHVTRIRKGNKQRYRIKVGLVITDLAAEHGNNTKQNEENSKPHNLQNPCTRMNPFPQSYKISIPYMAEWKK